MIEEPQIQPARAGEQRDSDLGAHRLANVSGTLGGVLLDELAASASRVIVLDAAILRSRTLYARPLLR